MSEVNVYGAEWCGDTSYTREHLDDLGIEYNFFDVDTDSQAKEWVKDHNDGKQKLPTLEIGRTILSIPDNSELDKALRDSGLLP